MRLYIAQTDENSYVLTRIECYRDLYIDGKKFTGTLPQIIDINSDFKYVKRIDREVLYYENEYGRVDVDEYNRVYNETHDDEGDYITFDDEILWRKKYSRLSPVEDRKEIFDTPEIIVYKIIIPENRNIECIPSYMSNISLEDLRNGTYFVYSPKCASMFYDALMDMGIDPKGVEMDPTNIKYTKIDGEYIFLGENIEMKIVSFVTYEYALQRYEEDMDMLREKIDMFIRKHSKKPINSGYVVSNLLSIINDLKSISIRKEKDDLKMKRIIQKIQKLVKEVEVSDKV